jgi:hypothetical protein
LHWGGMHEKTKMGGWGGGKASSSWTSVSSSRATREAWEAKRRYEEKHSVMAKWEMEVVKVEVRAKQHRTLDPRIMEDIKGWVEHPIHSWTQDTKYFRITEMYWLVKTLVAQAFEKKQRRTTRDSPFFHNI